MLHQFGKPQPFRALDDEFSIEIPDLDPEGSAPDFSDIFGEEGGSRPGTDTRPTRFKKIESVLEAPRPVFTQEFYKSILVDQGEIAKKIHQLLQDFLKATDPQDRSMLRGRLTPAFWELYGAIAAKVATRLPESKLMFLRYGILLPTTIEAEQRQVLASIPWKNNSGEPVMYADEWLREVGFGRVSTSAVDETKSARSNETARFNAVLEKTRGRHEAQLQLIRNLVNEQQDFEKMLLEHAQNIGHHSILPGPDNLPAPYTDSQRSSFGEITELMRKLSLGNKRLQVAYAELEGFQEQLENLRSKGNEIQGETQVDAKVLVEEVNTVKQMHKMCVGRQGNHFPMLIKTYFRGGIRDIATRENVINALADIEYFDPGMFLRTFKQQTNRIVPNIILLPSYGDYGVCWEPFERHNRATSRGRIAIPMYPKDLRIAVVAAIADLRWQVAKEKAQHYWMEEGLTGWYYQWFSDRKMKGDVKDQFIEDYILWITKETEGTQKLEREVRDIFWRYMPFPQDLKDKLKNRGFVYAELVKKDFNRSISDGY